MPTYLILFTSETAPRDWVTLILHR
ncbi:hypothetical protein DSM3645_06379 [Blastopirellula marina DSM 3645]|uniref:Uncharacterized protein n=1 Tax=Blastopirellula marina DSM 3645 TaxID=314230 RepID=A4A2Q1_9BACT|nr:hypothetical protein DSM3645_06379 [Blastopirellula marina DSM 3645]